ncbi:mannosyltransferase family protein [Scytonema sp. NUACC26]|uniref:mannosyltransferase family protein n=1 Tax=Scytonema sp. NUACC26 TaxID=3140176 RepID=UPI0034DBA1AD
MTKLTSRATQLHKKYKLITNGFLFVIAMWLISRLVVVVGMQVIAPILYTSPVQTHWQTAYPLDFVPGFIPKPSWELFSHWDGKWYGRIVLNGYDYADDGQQHSVAFYPVFPLVIRGVMMLGLPFEVAGTLVSNFSFLGALLLLYSWTKDRHGIHVARWVIAVIVWCPFSLFCTVIYTEGLFLLLTTAALRAFDKRQHIQAAIWGALASATRATGVTLIPAFLFVAWREKRPAIAYVAGLAVGIGLVSFSLYCGVRFGDPLAFIRIQKAWAQPNWWFILRDAVDAGNDSLIKVVMVFGGGYLLWYLRTKISSVAIVYGFCSLLVMIFSGALMSINRYAYGVVSLSIAFGLVLSQHLRWGYAILTWFAISLFFYAIDFAIWNWVA